MKLGSGLTPPQLVDEVLQKRIERVSRDTGVTPVIALPWDEDGRFVVDALGRELRAARLQLRISQAAVAMLFVAIVALLGLRLAGV